jgi:predicted nucleic acid-binding protein
MIFDQIPSGVRVFLDANALVYHFTNDPKFGLACNKLLKRIEPGDVSASTSGDVLGDVAHRLMTIEASAVNGWPQTGIAARLRKHRGEIAKLRIFREAVARIPLLGIQFLAVTQPMIEAATLLSQQHELLTGDALVVAVMQAHGLTHLASADADFDRVPAIARFAPA